MLSFCFILFFPSLFPSPLPSPPSFYFILSSFSILSSFFILSFFYSYSLSFFPSLWFFPSTSFFPSLSFRFPPPTFGFLFLHSILNRCRQSIRVTCWRTRGQKSSTCGSASSKPCSSPPTSSKPKAEWPTWSTPSGGPGTIWKCGFSCVVYSIWGSVKCSGKTYPSLSCLVRSLGLACWLLA